MKIPDCLLYKALILLIFIYIGTEPVIIKYGNTEI